MSFSTGTMLVMICSVLTGLIVEAIKNMVEVKKPNIVAAVVSVIVGVAVSIAYMVYASIAVDATVIIYIVSIVLFSWLCAMLGYEKVMQTIVQIKR